MKEVTIEGVVACIALLFTMGQAALAVMRRLAKGSFATHADVRALEMTMTTTHINHSSRIGKVEFDNQLLAERMNHYPNREQFDGIKDQIAELRQDNATVMTKLEEMPRLREAIEDLSREIRENRK